MGKTPQGQYSSELRCSERALRQLPFCVVQVLSPTSRDDKFTVCVWHPQGQALAFCIFSSAVSVLQSSCSEVLGLFS